MYIRASYCWYMDQEMISLCLYTMNDHDINLHNKFTHAFQFI